MSGVLAKRLLAPVFTSGGSTSDPTRGRLAAASGGSGGAPSSPQFSHVAPTSALGAAATRIGNIQRIFKDGDFERGAFVAQVDKILKETRTRVLAESDAMLAKSMAASSTASAAASSVEHDLDLQRDAGHDDGLEGDDEDGRHDGHLEQQQQQLGDDDGDEELG